MLIQNMVKRQLTAVNMTKYINCNRIQVDHLDGNAQLEDLRETQEDDSLTIHPVYYISLGSGRGPRPSGPGYIGAIGGPRALITS